MILLMVVLTVMSIITLTIIMTPVGARNNKANTLIFAATVNEGALATNKGKGKGIGSKYYDLTILIFTIEI